VRAGVARLQDDSFVKDGSVIAFQRVYLTGAANRESADAGLRFMMSDSGTKQRGRKKKHREPSRPNAATPEAQRPEPSAGSQALFEALRTWRLAEARKTGVPAFRILHDRTLLSVATETPLDEAALLRVAGIGPGLARRYGTALLDIVARHARGPQ
jgi:superfamily II DNA helicase RecQ